MAEDTGRQPSYPSSEDIMDPRVYGRCMTALNHEEPDRVPIWDLVDSWPTYQHFAPGETDPVVATAKVFNGLGIDMCRSIYMPQPPEAEGAEHDHGSCVTKVSGQTHWMVEYPIKTPEDIANWDSPPITEEQARDEVAGWVKARDVMAPQTMLVPCQGMGFHAAYGMMGLTLFSYALYDQREHIERIIDNLNQRYTQVARAYAEAQVCPMHFIGDDIAYKNRTLVSMETLKELFFPYLARMCEPLVNAGIEVIYHTDGYVMDIIDGLLDAGVTGLNPLEPLAGNDIAAMKKRYGDNLVLVGGMDCSQLLPLGTVRDVREGVKQLLRDAGHGGGLFIGSSSEVVPATPVENIFAFYEACHDFGRYPLKV